MLTRRNFLFYSGVGLATTLIKPTLSFANIAKGDVRALTLYNIHTDDFVADIPYFENGKFVKSNLNRLNNLLRDRNTDVVHNIDPTLFDTIYSAQILMGLKNPTINIVSGYRSPATNKAMAAESNNVSRKSYHMSGKAIDFYIEGANIRHVRKSLLYLKQGGVGYYPGSGFVHIDKGYFRTW
jgi:uncharacterized protein YcbK (DUF882 family)